MVVVLVDDNNDVLFFFLIYLVTISESKQCGGLLDFIVLEYTRDLRSVLAIFL